jgi:hypothetical protein
VRYVHGPLPAAVCSFVSVMRHATFVHYILFFDFVSVIKYNLFSKGAIFISPTPRCY